MGFTMILACVLGSQQLSVEPAVLSVGQRAVVTVQRAAEPAPGVEILVESPEGVRRVIGTSDERGQLEVAFVEPGPHALGAEVDGVRCFATVAVGPARRPWLLALGSVPLGLALLWLHLRRMPGRRSGPAPS